MQFVAFGQVGWRMQNTSHQKQLVKLAHQTMPRGTTDERDAKERGGTWGMQDTKGPNQTRESR